MKYLFFIIFLSLSVSLKAQILSVDTINNVKSATYPYLVQNYKIFYHQTDSIYPNRTLVGFVGLNDHQKDSLVTIAWTNLKIAFYESLKREDLKILPKKENDLFFTLYFNESGKLDYLLYNWMKDYKGLESLEIKFKKFLSNYDYSEFPKGEKWSQCGTFIMKKNGQ